MHEAILLSQNREVGKGMVRGTRRQMIVVRTAESRYFARAYFVLRRCADTYGDETDILREADALLSECNATDARKRERRRAFLWGALCGSLVAALALGVPLILTALSRACFF